FQYLIIEIIMAEPTFWYHTIPVCLICALYLASFYLYLCATNSLIYSTVCLLRANESFCHDIDRNKTLRIQEEAIQREASQWSLYGTICFSVIAAIVSPIYGSLSDIKNRKFPILLTLSNAIITGIFVTVGSVFQGKKLALILYLVANIINGFGGGTLLLISSCFGYATDLCSRKEEHVQKIAIVEASLNIGVIGGYLLCTFIFDVHGKIWHILLVHIILLVLAVLIALIFLRKNTYVFNNVEQTDTLSFGQKLARPFRDIYDLIRELKQSNLVYSFLLLLTALFFYELLRMGTSAINYLYLHHLSFSDGEYSLYYMVEQTATSLCLLLLATVRKRLLINDMHLAIIGLCLSLVGPLLFALAYNKAMVYGAIPSTMFTIYFAVCLRNVLSNMVSESGKGKAFSFVALIQNLDVVIGSVACIEIYRSTISTFPGLVFIFGISARLVALVLVLCYSLPVIENRSSLIHEDVAAHNYKHVNQLISNKLASPTNETQTQTQNQMQLQMMNEYHITQLSKDLLASQRSLPKFEMPKNFNVSQIESNLKRFGVNSLELDKHVEGLPLELDGKVNKDFHREIFLGNHELFENEMMNNEDVRKRKLTQIFRTADTDDDNKLSKKELQNWVLKNIETHTNEARDKNSRLFLLIDANKDGILKSLRCGKI
ncbi:unnamed protein product, partial [Didymodactylos carnosus]